MSAADTLSGARQYPGSGQLAIQVGSMMCVAAALSAHGMHNIGQGWDLWSAIVSPDPTNLTELLLHFSFLPRLVVSILAGAMLALAGVVFQQVLRNPLAEPTTLGASSGAYLAMVAATLVWPEHAGISQELIAIGGAGCATGLVFLLAAGGGLSPLTLILSGLVVGLLAGTATSVLTLFFRESLVSVFVWGSGSLVQNDWSGVAYLAPRLLGALVIVAMLLRPLELFALDDDGARSVGLPTNMIRLVALLLAVAVSAVVVSSVGIIGFIGLAAPALVRLGGARTFRQRVIWAPLFGAALLWLADQSVQLISSQTREWPTGILTAFLGAPLLLWMLPRLRHLALGPMQSSFVVERLTWPWAIICIGTLGLALGLYIAIALGESSTGWHWASGADLQSLLPLRAPRAVAAMAAGSMLAIAGATMQRLTGNPMASPEVLGISVGASLGVIVSVFVAGQAAGPGSIFSASAGAFSVLALMLSLGSRAAYSPERMLLTGIALGTAFGALVSMLLALGDPRLGALLNWMAGSTYHVTANDALVACLVATALMALTPFLARWLEILPLGEAAARSVGINLGRSRLAALLLSAVATGAATLIVGPLSFVGLMAPHIARMAGFQRVMPHMMGSALLGAFIMLVADWLGRNLLFPFQVPAGLLATVIGGPYFLWLMWKKSPT